MYISRKLEKTILEASSYFPVVLLTGPRQVGKTTMLRKISESNRNYVTLDDPIARDLAINDPALFLQRYQTPVLIDEIQYAPDLLPYIKIQADEQKTKGSFWLTGSQMFNMMKSVSESLAGRAAVISMPGLSNSELDENDFAEYTTDPEILLKRNNHAKKQNLNIIFERIHHGTMPALYETPQPVELFYSSYINTYLERDVRQLTQVGDMNAFFTFLTACAARTSQMVSYTELASDAGISAPTAKKWLSILEASGVVYLLQPYFNNALKRIVKSPNLYFLDTGLCAYLTRWTSPQALEISAMSGAFFETYVISEIIKSFYNVGKRPPIYYYRDTDKKEIDLIIEKDATLFPIEVKKSASPKRNAIKNFEVLKKTGKNIGHGNVICLANDLYPINENNSIVPVWLI